MASRTWERMASAACFAWFFVLVTLQSIVEAQILHPHVPKHIEKHNFKHLEPGVDSKLWYRQKIRNNLNSVMHASIGYNWRYPAVVLDHSSHTSEECSASIMNITFTTDEAYQHALNSWNDYSQVVFLSSSKSCTRFYDSQQRTMFLSERLQYYPHIKTISATGSFLESSHVAKDGEIQCE